MNNDSNVMMPGIQNSFLNPYSLKPKNNKDKSYCDQCDKWISKYYLKEHMSRIHKIDYEIENPNASGTVLNLTEYVSMIVQNSSVFFIKYNVSSQN